MFGTLFSVIALSVMGTNPQPPSGNDTKSKQLTPEQRAITYLAREVAAWKTKNKCFSCHNNGDAARALYQARRLKYRVRANAVAETTRWLRIRAKGKTMAEKAPSATNNWPTGSFRMHSLKRS